MALSRSTAPRPILSVTRARQARLGRRVLWILLTTLLLVVLGFLATWTWKARDLASVEPNNAKQPADAQVFAAPPSGPATRQNNAVGGPLAQQAEPQPAASRP
jgi:hypothetical protein